MKVFETNLRVNSRSVILVFSWAVMVFSFLDRSERVDVNRAWEMGKLDNGRLGLCLEAGENRRKRRSLRENTGGL